ncbi:hypothetical protein [Naasia aerilata]|uniref:LPXTG-motif cell wall-anchored protein n=1 Tax=Naasia aerilata TaxID=1162966 RepID=A0ABM8GCT2_9MICO|nr:hypothetical protein [Naasia aerilata]BDZ46063.1 hypothetical protein GCM10025866_19720 [Naasia aerilata]
MIAAVRLATLATVSAVGIALALAAQASPASAAEEPAGALISLDGSTFSPTPAGSLFPTGVVLIPGGTADATFWVRNSSAAPADLRIAIADVTATASAFIESLTLQAATPTTPAGDAVPLSGGDCTPVLTGEILPAGATTQVHIVLAMSPDSDNAGQGATADARLAVSLSETTGGTSLPPNCDTTTGTPTTTGSTTTGGTSEGTADAATDDEGQDTADAEVAILASPSSGAASAPAPSPAASEDAPAFTLPTLPFAGQPAMLPGLLAGLGILAAAAAAFVLVLKRKRNAE